MGHPRLAALPLPLHLLLIGVSASAGIGFPTCLPHWTTCCLLVSHMKDLPIFLAIPCHFPGVLGAGTVPAVCACAWCQLLQAFPGAGSSTWCRNPKSLTCSSSVGDTRCRHLLRGSCCIAVACLRRTITSPSPPQTSSKMGRASKGPSLPIQRQWKVSRDRTHKGIKGPSSPLTGCLRHGLFA
uniref:Interleukin 17 receptor E n=1 Tax=Pipistrellus kuhlii TaxID=59472 RepID=A0A7J7WDK9_PIPKU|nr:interleukin 17 receptor E [Pipistrellus kuhlii]